MLLLAQRGLQGGAPSVLTRPNSDLVVGQGLVPSGAIWWDPTSGSNANNGSTKLLAKQTLAGVEAVVAPGGTVVVAAGIHAMALWVTPGVSGSSGSPITYMAEPGAVCGFGWNPQFAAFRTPGHSLFEVSDAATKTYRTKQPLQFAEGGVRGQWFEGGEWWDLLPEGTDGTNLGTGAAYLGPSARVRSDGRLYVRFQRPSSARTTSSWPSYHAGTSGGVFVVPGSENPADYPLYLYYHADNGGLYLTGASFLSFKSLNFLCVDRMLYFDDGNSDSIVCEDCVFLAMSYGVFGRSDALPDDGVLRRSKFVAGRMDYFDWDTCQNVPDTLGFSAFFNHQANIAGWLIEDCYVSGFFDCIQGTVNSGMTVRYNWFEYLKDDMVNYAANALVNFDFGHNVIIGGPLISGSLSTATGNGTVYVHHNLVFARHLKLWHSGQVPGPIHLIGWHGLSSSTRFPWKVYNNTAVVNSGAFMILAHGNGEDDNISANAHEVYNNVLVRYADGVWRSFSNTEEDAVDGYWSLDGTSNEAHDNNHYCRLLSYASATDAMFGPMFNRALQVGGPYTYATAAALAGAAENVIDAEVNGSSEQQTSVINLDAASPFVSVNRLDFRLKVGHAARTGAKNLAASGWPGATSAAWRGALDPAGDGQLGPRQVSDGLTLTLTGLSVGTVVFTEIGGTAADPFIAPSGTFIQDHTIATNPMIPAMVIHFCRDRGTGRMEMWSDYGGLYNHGGTATDLGAHTATILDDGAVIATVSLAKHGWHQGWRWQESERPWFRTIEEINAERLLMPMDFEWCAALADFETDGGGVFNNYAMPAAGNLAATTGLRQNMPDVGGRPDIGPLTGWTAAWMYGGGVTTTTLRAQAEVASSAIPSRKMDENTLAPLDIYDHPNVTWHANNAAAPEYVQHTTSASGWAIDYAHMPNCCAIPYMFTEDPYYLRGLQFTLTRAWFTRNLRWSQPLSNSLGPFPDNEVRGHSYVWRDTFNCWNLTPDNAPSWMNPKSYFTQLLTDWSLMWERIWITNAASIPVWNLLRSFWQYDAGIQFPAWQEHWAEAILGMGVYIGAPNATKWRAIWEWKAPFSNYHNNNNPDWDRRYGIRYREDGGGATWAAHYALQLVPPPPVPGTVGINEFWNENQEGVNILDRSYESMGAAASALKLLNGGVPTASNLAVTEALTWRRNAIANEWGSTTKKWSFGTTANWAGDLRLAQAPTDGGTFSSPGTLLDQVAAVGVTGIRHNLIMTDASVMAGVYTAYDPQWAAMQARRLALYLTLFDGNAGATAYPGDDPNTTTAAAERTAWAAIAFDAAQYLHLTYPGLLKALEVWNEPDGTNWPVPADRLALLTAAVKTAIRSDPTLNHVLITGPTTTVGEAVYWQALVDAGFLQHVDWVSHHIYSSADRWPRRIADLRAKMGQVGQANKPIVLSEYGGHITAGAHEVPADLVMLKALGLTGASYFPSRDYGSFFTDHGLLNTDGTVATQGTAWNTWHANVGVGAIYVGKASLPFNIEAHHFTVGAAHVWVVWASSGAPIIDVTGTHTAEDHTGATITNSTPRTLGIAPVYLLGNVTLALSAGQEALLAGSIAQFSLVQGQDGWTYQWLLSGTYTNATADAVANKWVRPGSTFWQISVSNLHPATSGGAVVYAVRKWVVPAGVSKVRVSGSWSRSATAGDGDDVTILHNSTVRFRRSALKESGGGLQESPQTFNQVFTVIPNDTIEFRVGTGPALNDSSDTASLDALIYQSTATVTAPDNDGVVPPWYGLLDFGAGNASRYYTIPNAAALNLGNGAAWAWGFMTQVSANGGPAYQYVLNTGTYGAASSFTVNLHEDPGGLTPNKYELRTRDADGVPNVYIPSASSPGGDNVLRLVVVQFNGSSTAEMFFCTPGGTAVSQGTFDATGFAGLSPAGNWFLGARSDLESQRFWKSKMGGLFRANRLLTTAEIANIAAGTSPITILGASCIEAWAFASGAATTENGLVQGATLAATRQGTWT